jgi:hypothetical protein
VREKITTGSGSVGVQCKFVRGGRHREALFLAKKPRFLTRYDSEVLLILTAIPVHCHRLCLWIN